jgi:selenide,water dikinase
MAGVKAMTDVTGFGLLGHLLEICEGSGVGARLDYDAVPKLPHIELYLEQGCSPGGAQRNFESCGHHVGELPEHRRKILCDPQTSGGLLIAVAPDSDTEARFIATSHAFGLDLRPIGTLAERRGAYVVEVV